MYISALYTWLCILKLISSTTWFHNRQIKSPKTGLEFCFFCGALRPLGKITKYTPRPTGGKNTLKVDNGLRVSRPDPIRSGFVLHSLCEIQAMSPIIIHINSTKNCNFLLHNSKILKKITLLPILKMPDYCSKISWYGQKSGSVSFIDLTLATSFLIWSKSIV